MNPSTWDRDDLDMELLAGFVDGTLSAEERRRAEHLLATSEGAREVVAEAIRLKDDLEPGLEPLPAGVQPLSSGPMRPRRWLGWGLPLLAAAALATLLLVPSLRRSGPAAGPYLPPEVMAQLPAHWQVRPWGVTRSFRASLSPEVTAFRLGTLWTDAALSWEAGDTAVARTLLASMTGLLAPFPQAAEARARVEEAVRLAAEGAPAEAGQALLDGAGLEGVLPAPYVAVGRWVEGVKLAAMAGRHELLAPRGPLGPWPAEASAPLPPQAGEALADLQALLDEPGFSQAGLPAVLEHVVVLQSLLGA